jgi:hypothetical protein
MRNERWEVVIVVYGSECASVQTWIGTKKETEERAARFARNPRMEVVNVRKSA